MRVRLYRNGLYDLLRSGVDDRDTFIVLITHISKASINREGNSCWSMPRRDRPQDAIVRGVDDRDVVLTDIRHPGIAIVVG